MPRESDSRRKISGVLIMGDDKLRKKYLRIARAVGISEEETRRRQATSKLPLRDVLWGEYNRLSGEYAKNAQWGLFRNLRFAMAQHLEADGSPDKAIVMLLVVCHFDINGPNNVGIPGEPPFSPRGTEGLAPGILDRLRIVNKRVGFDEARMRELYLEHAEDSGSKPIPVGDGWKVLGPALRKAGVYDGKKPK